VGALFDIAKAYGCYKVSLKCKEHNVKFYEECGYEVSGLAMQVFIERKWRLLKTIVYFQASSPRYMTIKPRFELDVTRAVSFINLSGFVSFI
jgi:hypothetical protein